MTLPQLIEWAFMGLVCGTLAFAVNFLRDISRSINQLNVQVGSILERTTFQGKQLDNHEDRIEDLEKSIPFRNANPPTKAG